ncbi:MAG: hypothetical protein ACLVG5_02235 [Clostridium sp.]
MENLTCVWGIIAGDLAVYIGMIYYYLLETLGAGTVFSAVQQVGAEQAKLNLTTSLPGVHDRGMLVFTVFLLHCGWDCKNAEDRRG